MFLFLQSFIFIFTLQEIICTKHINNCVCYDTSSLNTLHWDKTPPNPSKTLEDPNNKLCLWNEENILEKIFFGDDDELSGNEFTVESDAGKSLYRGLYSTHLPIRTYYTTHKVNGYVKSTSGSTCWTNKVLKKMFKKVSAYKMCKMYAKTGWDIGHLAVNVDFQNTNERKKTFDYVNGAPQAPDFNRYRWYNIECRIRQTKKHFKVITGTIGSIGTLKQNGKINIPNYFYKIIISEDTTPNRGIVFIGLNCRSLEQLEWRKYGKSDLDPKEKLYRQECFQRICIDKCRRLNWFTSKDCSNIEDHVITCRINEFLDFISQNFEKEYDLLMKQQLFQKVNQVTADFFQKEA